MIIRTSEIVWTQIDQILNRSFNQNKTLEWGIIGIVEKLCDEVLLIREVFPPTSQDLNQSEGGLVFLSPYIRRAQLYAQRQGKSGLTFFHTHPLADDHVSFSIFDDAQEPLLMKNLQEVWPGSEHISIVVGKNSHKGRVYLKGKQVQDLMKLYVIGRTIKVFSLLGNSAQVPMPSHIFDRAKEVTSAGALQILKDMKIAIIGAGGTGCLMVELLRRAGCGSLVLIDDDIVEDTNLNRLLFASSTDVEDKNKKVSVALRGNDQCALGNKLEIIDGNVTSSTVLHKLNGIDLLIGCIDKDYPRYVLNDFAVKYFVPYVDLGTEIGIAGNKLQTLDARVTYVYPGGPCLNCRGLIDHERIRLEGLEPQERRRHIGLGYCQDIDIKQPAVMELNMRATSFAALFIRHLVQPFLDQSGEMDFRESVTSMTFKKISFKKQELRCEICGYKKQ
ncbi:MAG: ThiF family adenylyltransferase [Candidatus Omnitrophica bacterium]|nr:ThiF family adenylyltransferase [Candidatus Omnitrophota bacterium]